MIQDPRPYQSAIGAMHYLTHSRTDIATAVSILAAYCAKPTVAHYNALHRLIAYIADTVHFGKAIHDPEMPQGHLNAYCDAGDNNEDNGRARGGFIIFFNGTPILTQTKALTVPTKSTFAAETVQLSVTTDSIIPIRRWTAEICNEPVYATMVTLEGATDLTTIHCDNRATVIVANDPARRPSKAILRKFLSTRHYIHNNIVRVVHCDTKDNHSDGLTKPLTGKLFLRSRRLMGITTFDRLKAHVKF
jgi:hypothetical protein